MTLRSTLNFVSALTENLRVGFAKFTVCIKLFNKIAWIAEGKVTWLKYSDTIISFDYLQVPLDYLSHPSISAEDKTIDIKLKDDQYDLSGNKD